MTIAFTARYYPPVYRDGKMIGTGNIIWPKKYPMRGGVFPIDHPCAPGKAPMDDTGQFGSSDALSTFRALEYWASCFPEGDGITMKPPPNKSDENVVADIERTFGWTVKLERR